MLISEEEKFISIPQSIFQTKSFGLPVSENLLSNATMKKVSPFINRRQNKKDASTGGVCVAILHRPGDVGASIFDQYSQMVTMK